MSVTSRMLVRVLTIAFLTFAAIDDAAAQLGARPAEEWIHALESQARVDSLKVTEVVKALGLKPGLIVADIGAGAGVFTVPLALEVRPGGKVYAVDVNEAMIEHVNEKRAEFGLNNMITTVYADYADPLLEPNSVDLAFMCETLHHIQTRAGYLKALAGALKAGGRVAVIEFKPGQGEHRDQADMQVSADQTTQWMTAAGLKKVEEINLFPDRYFVIYAKP